MFSVGNPTPIFACPFQFLGDREICSMITVCGLPISSCRDVHRCLHHGSESEDHYVFLLAALSLLGRGRIRVR